MKNFIFIFLCTKLQFEIVHCDSIGYKCLIYIQDVDLFYDLGKIYNGKNIENIDIKNQSGYGVTYNPCRSVNSDLEGSLGFVKTPNEQKVLSHYNPSDKKNNTKWSFNAYSTSLYNGNYKKFIEKQKSLQISGQNVSKDDFVVNIFLKFNCNEGAKGIQNISAIFTESSKSLEISMESMNACGFRYQSFWDDFGVTLYIIEGQIIALSILLCSVSIYYVKISIAILGYSFGTIVAYLSIEFVSELTDFKFNENFVIEIVFIIAIILAGALFCYGALLNNKCGMICAGGAQGYFLGCMTYSLFIYELDGIGLPICYYIVVALFIIAFCVISIFIEEYIIILAAAVEGGYLLVRMVGNIIGNYVSEDLIARELQTGKLKKYPWTMYFYISSQILIAFIVIDIQCYLIRKKSEKELINKEKISIISLNDLNS